MTDSFKLKFHPGLVGAAGETPQLSVGTTTTSAAGTTATVSLTGDAPNYSLSFSIPRGADGSGNVNASASFGTTGLFIVSGDTTTYVLATTTVQVGTINAATAGTLSAGTTTISVARVDTLYGTTTITFAGSGLITQGKHTINMPAGSMTARTTNGATASTYESPTNKNMIRTMDFGTTTTTYVQFSVQMPKSWNQSSTLTAQFVWSPVGSTTTNNGVIWFIQSFARGDGDSWDGAFGTAVATADASGTSTISYITSESANITPSGSPAQSDVLNFQIFRTYGTASGGSTDTLTSVARLHNVRILYYVNAATDA